MTTKNTAKSSNFGELKSRLFFLLLALIVYRIGTHVPVMGIDPVALAKNSASGFSALLNMFTGGAFSNASIFALGVMPYISSSIIIQLMSSVFPPLEALKREGATGQRKITQYTRIGALIIALIQGCFMVSKWVTAKEVFGDIVGLPFYVVAVLSLVAGTMFLMWLGEQITERGLGNGVSILITAGIVANLPSSLQKLFTTNNGGGTDILFPLLICILVPLLIFGVIFIERAQRKIVVNYAKRQVGNKIYAAQSSHLPLKINVAGVIPPIFASSLLLLPSLIADGVSPEGLFGFGQYIKDFGSALAPAQPLHMVVFAGLIILFCFFYTGLVFNSKETADNLKKSGAFIPGIRPGEQTAKFVDKILMRLTLVGAIYIALVCLLPEFLTLWKAGAFTFGGTSVLIVVVVTMDFMMQVQQFQHAQKYESLLKKANFKK